MAASSYERICQKLMQTPEVVQIRTNLRTWLSNVHISSHKWDLITEEWDKSQQRNIQTRPRVEAIFIYFVGPKSQDFQDVSRPRVDVTNSVTPEDFLKVLRAYWPEVPSEWNPIRIPTYHCKRDSMVNGRRDPHVKSFPSFATDSILREFADEIKEANEKLTREALAFINSDGFEAERLEALKGFAISDIMRTAAKWTFLGKEVLKDGLDGYIIHEVMES